MSLPIILTEVGPAPLPTKDVRRNRDTKDFDAYLIFSDGTEAYLGSRARSWDAEELCNQALFEIIKRQPVVAPEEVETLPFDNSDVTAAELEHEACIGAEEVFTYCGSSVTIMREINDATSENVWESIDYRAGDVFLSIDPADPTDVYLEVDTSQKQGATTLRNLWAMLHHPAIQRVMGFEQPAITIEACISDDVCDPDRIGEQIGTDYRCGTDSNGRQTYLFIPTAPTDNPLDVPILSTLGEVGWPLDEVERVLPQILALLNDPQVQAARARFKAQQQRQWVGLHPVRAKTVRELAIEMAQESGTLLPIPTRAVA